MKTEKSIEEKAKDYSFNMYDSSKNVILQMEQAFIDGYELCQKEWEEKTRWIPVEERLPNEKKKYLVKDLYDSIHTATFNIYSKRWSFFGYSDTITHYREIIE